MVEIVSTLYSIHWWQKPIIPIDVLMADEFLAFAIPRIVKEAPPAAPSAVSGQKCLWCLCTWERYKRDDDG